MTQKNMNEVNLSKTFNAEQASYELVAVKTVNIVGDLSLNGATEVKRSIEY
jgi:hypothetical protein